MRDSVKRSTADRLGALAAPAAVLGSLVAFIMAARHADSMPLLTVSLIVVTVAVVALTVHEVVGARQLRRKDEELLRQEQRFQVLVEQSPVIVYMDGLDDTASTLYISPQIGQLTGYAAEEWRGDPELWPRILHPEDRERALAATARHNETGEPFSLEYRLVARDGRVVWIHDEAIVIRGPDGAFLYSQGVMQDITTAKEAEERIQFLAHRDGLTGLPNRTVFRELADLAL